jgi:hypothetical protein
MASIFDKIERLVSKKKKVRINRRKKWAVRRVRQDNRFAHFLLLLKPFHILAPILPWFALPYLWVQDGRLIRILFWTKVVSFLLISIVALFDILLLRERHLKWKRKILRQSTRLTSEDSILTTNQQHTSSLL